MNRSIEAMNQFSDVIQQLSEDTIVKAKDIIDARNQTAKKLEDSFDHNREQIAYQLRSEKESFENFSKAYAKIKNEEENSTDPQKYLRNKNKALKVLENSKVKVFEDYSNTLMNYYDVSDVKDKQYYDLTIASYKAKLDAAKDSYAFDKYVETIEEAQDDLNNMDRKAWVVSQDAFKDAQKVMSKADQVLKEDYKEAVRKAMHQEEDDISLGVLYKDNRYLDDGIVGDALKEALGKYCSQHALKMRFYDHFDHYLVISKDKELMKGIKDVFEYLAMKRSLEQPMHIYYDYSSFDGHMKDYRNATKVQINDAFVKELEEESNAYPKQRIVVFMEKDQLPESMKEFMVKDPKNVQFIIFSTSDCTYADFNTFTCRKSNKDNKISYMSSSCALFVNTVVFDHLYNAKPMEIETMNHFEDDFKEHLQHPDTFLVGNTTLSMEDNYVIVSKDKQKRTAFITQLVLQILHTSKTKYIYYEDFNNTPLRELVNNYDFEELYSDSIGELMDDLFDQYCILVDPDDEIEGYIETLLDDGHILVTSDHIMDGYKNIDLDRNVVEEYGHSVSYELKVLGSNVLLEMVRNFE